MKPRSECADLYGILDHEAMIAIARTISALIHVGNPTPVIASIGRWCTDHPQPGDLVVEVSSFGLDADRLGIFESGSVSDECVILVQTEPPRTCTWSNASFLRLPRDDAQRREALGR